MKKLYALLLVIVMLAGFVIPTFATQSPRPAPSPSASPSPAPSARPAPDSPSATPTPTPTPAPTAAPGGEAATTVTTAIPADNTALARTITTNVEGVTKTVNNEMTAYVTDELMKNQQFRTDYSIPADAKVAAVFEIRFDGEIPPGGVIIPMTVNNAKAGDYVVVMHRKADGVWEVVGRGLLGADLVINTTFTSFSPVMILVTDAQDVAATGIRAPKTGP